MKFAKYLRQLQQRHSSTVREFAAMLGIDDTHLSRAMGSTGLPFDVAGCLRLAKVTGENPSDVLRHAGKGHIADAIEELYPAPRPTTERQAMHNALVLKLETSGLEEDRDFLDFVATIMLAQVDSIQARRAHSGRRYAIRRRGESESVVA